jgi:hypothetical protein
MPQGLQRPFELEILSVFVHAVAMDEPIMTWDEANPAVGLRRMADYFREHAIQTFLNDKTHVELFFLVNRQGEAQVVPAAVLPDRDQLMAALRAHVQANDVYGVIHIVEAWSYHRREGPDHTFTQIMSGEIKVSELRDEDRAEVLMVRMENRDGDHRLWSMPIQRDGDKVTLGKPIESDDPPGGRFASFFSAA